MMYNKKLKVDESFNVVKSRCTGAGIQYENCDVSSIDFSGKTIMVLCGNNTKNPERANAYATYCFKWLNNYLEKEDITAYSIYYPQNQPLLNTLTPNLAFDYKELANIIFKPVLGNKNKVKSVDEVAEALSNVVFFGHSMGGYVMNELMINFKQMMKDNNFSESDIRKVFSNVVFVGYSPFVLVDEPIKSIIVAPVYDTVGSTKLVYDKIKQSKDFASSEPRVDVDKICSLRENIHSDFIELYNQYTQEIDVIYYANKNTFISTPNLLYYDGIKEDHNLAGVVNYDSKSPYKTPAGEIITEMLNDVFCYSFMKDRRNFSIAELYQIEIGKLENYNKLNNNNKEL